MSMAMTLGWLSLAFQRLRATASPRISSDPRHEITPRDDEPEKFIFGVIGDSWASGVSWLPSNKFPDDRPDCLRYKYAWGTVVNSSYAEWIPPNMLPQFEFEACSGAHLEQMMDQMNSDGMTRPKVVLMEAGGNNADFYPMADACLFHSDREKDYGIGYEDDDPNNPKGDCRKEINLVRGRVEGDGMKNNVIDKIHKWRGNSKVMGNEASLFLLGYGDFFALSDNCNDWTFSVITAKKSQKVVKEMRIEFNDLLDNVNRAIREAAESFSDSKIQYIDINPAFDGHRFCEEGHSRTDQFNWNNKVRIWNSPGRWRITLKNGSEDTSYDMTADPQPTPPTDVIDQLLDHLEGSATQEGDDFVQSFRNPDHPDISMELRDGFNTSETLSTNVDGSRSRTLHPTEDGHKYMGAVLVDRLKQDFNPPPPSSTSSAPPSPTPPPPQGPTKALGILANYLTSLHTIQDLDFFNKVVWQFFATDYGQTVGCRTDSAYTEERTMDRTSSQLNYPGGTFNLNLFGEDCQYRNSGDNVGRLFCGDKEIECFDDPADTDPADNAAPKGDYAEIRLANQYSPIHTEHYFLSFQIDIFSARFQNVV